MQLQDLQSTPPFVLPEGHPLYRVHRTKPHPRAVRVGPLRLPPPEVIQPSRFALPYTPVAYFAAMPETAVYETLARREATLLSLDVASKRTLLQLRTTGPLVLLDLRSHAPTWPVLQSLRFDRTQELAKAALGAGYEGIVYRSPQHYGQDCFVIFGESLNNLKVDSRKLLVQQGRLLRVLEDAIVHAAIELGP